MNGRCALQLGVSLLPDEPTSKIAVGGIAHSRRWASSKASKKVKISFFVVFSYKFTEDEDIVRCVDNDLTFIISFCDISMQTQIK